MKNHLAIAAIAIAATLGAGAAFAQDVTPDNLFTPVTSGKTRAQVLAELRQAQQDGSIHAGDTGYMTPFHAVKTREQVRRETVAAMHDGEIARINAISDGGLMPASSLAAANGDARTASAQTVPAAQ